MKQFVKPCLKLGASLLRRKSHLIGRCANKCSKQVRIVTIRDCAQICILVYQTPCSRALHIVISGAAKCLLGLYSCFIALVVFNLYL